MVRLIAAPADEEKETHAPHKRWHFWKLAEKEKKKTEIFIGDTRCHIFSRLNMGKGRQVGGRKREENTYFSFFLLLMQSSSLHNKNCFFSKLFSCTTGRAGRQKKNCLLPKAINRTHSSCSKCVESGERRRRRRRRWVPRPKMLVRSKIVESFVTPRPHPLPLLIPKSAVTCQPIYLLLMILMQSTLY